MTEIKPLLEANSPTPQSSKNLEFIIGSNKLRYFGKPDVMAKHSDLIKDSLEIYANSTPPYPLATFAVVLQIPMTILWQDMNDMAWLGSQQYTLSLLEWLHMYRLMAYFGMDLKKYPTANMLNNFINSKEEEKKMVADTKNQETLIRIINDAFNTQVVPGSDMLFQKLYKDYPDIATKINYVPVYVNDQYNTYAERKALEDKNNFSKSNPGWYIPDNDPHSFRKDSDNKYYLDQIQWDISNSVKLRYDVRPIIRKVSGKSTMRLTGPKIVTLNPITFTEIAKQEKSKK